MLLRKWFIAFLTIALFMAILPAHAQDGLSDDEKALIEVVNAAQTDLQSRTSYHFVGEQATEQVITNGVGIRAIILNNEVTRSYEGDISVVSDSVVNSSVEVAQRNALRLNTASDPVNTTINVNLVVVDGAVYVSFPRVSDGLTGYPSDWVNLAEAGNLAGLDAVNMDSLLELSASTTPTYDVSEATVLAIEELGVDGDNRVIKVTLDASAALGDDIRNSMGTDGVDTTLVETLLTGATLEVLYYVNTDNSSLARVDSTLDINVELAEGVLTEDALSIVQSTQTSILFTDFDASVEITVPEPAPPADETATEDDSTDAADEG